MANFDINESSEDSFALTAAKPYHLNTSNYIDLSVTTQVVAFTAAQYSGVNIYALDAANAQQLLYGNGFRGYSLTPGSNSYGLNYVTLPAGRWWIGVSYSGSLGTSQSVLGFDEVSVTSLPGSNFIGNIPMSVSGNQGAWSQKGFTVTGSPDLYIETEGSGGKFMIMTDPQWASFYSKYANGYTGGSYTYTSTLSGTGTTPATEIEGDLRLPDGTYHLVWINDSGQWAGGAGNIEGFGNSGSLNVSNVVAPVNTPTVGNNIVTGTTGNDTLTVPTGNPTIDGGAGINTAVFSASKASYQLHVTGSSSGTVSGTSGVATLSNIERLKFSDGNIALDMGASNSGGEAALLIGAVLGNASLSNAALVGQLISYFDTGTTLHDAANVLVNTGVMTQLAGGSSTSAYVNLIYKAITGQVATPAVTASLTPYIDSGAYTKADFLSVVAGLPINQTNINLVGLAQTGLAYI